MFNIVSVISVNMAAPSPMLCPVLTGDTTLCFIIEGSALAETSSFQLGGGVHCQG